MALQQFHFSSSFTLKKLKISNDTYKNNEKKSKSWSELILYHFVVISTDSRCFSSYHYCTVPFIKAWMRLMTCWRWITCSKLTIETLRQGVKYVQIRVNNKDTRTTPIALNIFHTLFECLYCWLWAGKCWLDKT